MNFFVPDLASNEVAAAAAMLLQTISVLCLKDKAKTSVLLNAPEYLFVSTRVAAAYPQLLEAIIVRAFESHLPGQLAIKW